MVKKKKELQPPTEEPKEKTTRKDVKQRKEANKDTEFTCVKMSFNSLVENNFFNNGIQDIVLNINKICFLSYQLLNYHFTRLIQENKPLPPDFAKQLAYFLHRTRRKQQQTAIVRPPLTGFAFSKSFFYSSQKGKLLSQKVLITDWDT